MIPNLEKIKFAFAEWTKISGVHVTQSEETSLNTNTIGATRRIFGILKPTHQQQVSQIIKIASQYEVPLYTVSTGQNWGYGSSLPTIDNCVILNLSLLQKIIHFDPQLGYVTVEPGVTQQHLYEFLQEQNVPFMVPTTGAGPTCSILGNALEKGYGITPHEDHFSAILSLKAVLPDGTLYQSTLSELGGYRVDPIFKWKLGPYFDGLFAQGNFGVVTQITIALARRTENVTQFIAFIDDAHFEDAVTALRNIKQQLGSILGGVNIMNKRRLLAMIENRDVWNSKDVMSEMELRNLVKNRRLPDWAVLGGIYSPKELTAGAEEIIKREFRPFADKMVFLNRKKIDFIKKVLRYLPIPSLSRVVKGMDDGMSILEGVPSRVALPLAYLKNKLFVSSENKELQPDADRCGLIWFSPLVPIEPALVRDFVQEVTRVCISFGIEPLVTLTGISERCFDSTIPLVFDVTSEKEKAKARGCFDALIVMSREFGIFPYRLDVEAMRKYYDLSDSVSLEFGRKLKQAVDPKGILSPGRYSSQREDKLTD